MNQALGAFQRHEKLEFTQKSEPVTYSGKVRLEEKEVDGRHVLHLKTLDGRNLKFDLADVRVDPLNTAGMDL